MNQESEQPSTPGGERAERHERLGDAYITELADQAPNLPARMTLLNAYLQFGTPFALYLGLDGVDPYSGDIVETYKANYGGRYESKQHLMDQTLEDLGLREELDTFMADHMEFQGLLTFDYDTLWELLQDRWEIIDIGGVLYVFER